MLFSDIPGLKDIKSSLIDSFQQNHIAHAQLFFGTEGGGSLPLAISFATYLLCQNKQPTDACGECPSCHKMKKLIHPDVHFFYPKITASKDSEIEKIRSEASKNWRAFFPENPYGFVDQWAAFNAYENKNLLISKEDSKHIIQTVSMKSFEGGFKILILWAPEYMNPSAANAILKVLEEPPSQTIYLLVSHDIEAVIATIKSRTQLFTVPPFSQEELSDFLTTQKNLDLAHAQQVARISEGSLGRAILEAQSEETIAYNEFQGWMRECLGRDYSKLSARSEGFGKLPKAAQRNELNFSLTLLRESIILQAGDESMISRSDEEKDFIKKFSKAVSLEKLEKIYMGISTCMAHLSRNANAKISHLNLSLNISEVLVKK